MITTVLSTPVAFLMGQSPMELFINGGPVMWPILITSFVGLTVAIERIIFLIRESASRDPEVVDKMFDRVEADDPEGAIAVGKGSRDVVAKILTYALAHRDQSLSIAYMRAANNELRRYQQGTVILDTVITLSPLLGLLGTVTGMMRTFGNLKGDIAAAAGQITGGVAEALIATMCGLFIAAIIGLLPYNLLNGKIEQTKHDISDASNALAMLMAKKEKQQRAHV